MGDVAQSTEPLAIPMTSPSFHTTAINFEPTIAFSEPISVNADTVSHPCRTIIMANNFVLAFTEDDVPPPPAVSFSDDLDLFNEMWDDTSTFWKGRSYLVIKGYPIPLAYWKEVYTSKSKVGGSWKVDYWKGLKGQFFDFRVCQQVHRQFSILTSNLTILDSRS